MSQRSLRQPSTSTGAAPAAAERAPCRHDSSRADLSLDDHCLKCGVPGYWHFGHRHDKPHPSGKMLLSLGCPDDEETTDAER